MKVLLISLSGALLLGAGGYLFYSATDAEVVAADEAEEARGPRKRPGGGSPAPARAAAHSGDLEERVERLEAEVAFLKGQLRARPGRPGGSDGPSERARLDDPEASAFVYDVVEEAMADAREAERVEREERRRERMSEFREESLDALAQAANLPAPTREKIGGLWEAEQEQMLQLFSRVREEGGDFRAAREQAEAIRGETDAAAKALLDGDQQAAYDEHRPSPGGRGGGGGRGGRGGRGG